MEKENEFFDMDIMTPNKAVDDIPKVTPVEEELDIPKVNVNINLSYDKAVSKGDEQDYSDDISYARNILLKTLASSDKILESLMKKIVANDEMMDIDGNDFSKPQARYYEVSSLLTKAICDISKELINLHATNTKIKHENDWNKNNNDVNDEKQNTGMTSMELIRHIKEANNN